MKYSKSIAITLLGTDYFEPEVIERQGWKHFFTTPVPLDVFSVLLFFYLYEEGFTPNRFLQFFAGTQKITDLQERKDKFREAMDIAFQQLSQVKIWGTPFLTYAREGNNWNYTLSERALKLKRHFTWELEPGAFWPADHRLGIAVAYLGAYIYLLGICGKSEIDLSKLQGKKLLVDFHQGYDIWNTRTAIKALVRSFAAKGVFGYGKRLENLEGHILHVTPNRIDAGLKYHDELDDVSINGYQTVWRGRRPVRKEPVIIDLSKQQIDLKKSIDHLNDLDMDIRHGGIILPGQHYLEYQNNRLEGFIRYQCPVSKLKYPEWKNVTFGVGTTCSVIEIEFPRTMYVQSRLRQGWKKNELSSPFAVPKQQQALTVEIALEALMVYEHNPAQALACFRTKYTCPGVTNKDIEAFFNHLTQDYFQWEKFEKTTISEADYITQRFKLLFGAVHGRSLTPIVITPSALIVPRGTEERHTVALHESYRKHFGSRGTVRFKITKGDEVKLYKVTKTKHICEV